MKKILIVVVLIIVVIVLVVVGNLYYKDYKVKQCQSLSGYQPYIAMENLAQKCLDAGCQVVDKVVAECPPNYDGCGGYSFKCVPK